MSLINDALKKAQRQRTGDHSATSQPPMPGGNPRGPHASRSEGGLSPQIFLLSAGALLGVLIATGTVFFLRRDQPEPSRPVATAQVASSDPLASAKTIERPAAPTPPAPATEAKTTEPTLVVKTESATAPAVTAPAIVAPATSAESAAPKPATAELPAPSLKMIESIEALRVTGIRAGTGTDAKVLMNDRVYRLGDTVDHVLGIKLTGVTANSLSFRDASGATYTRNF